MLAGAALSAFAIFHSSECADVVNVPGGKGAVAVDRSFAEAIGEIAQRLIAKYRMLLFITASIVLALRNANKFYWAFSLRTECSANGRHDCHAASESPAVI